jgi:hypothetical protein
MALDLVKKFLGLSENACLSHPLTKQGRTRVAKDTTKTLIEADGLRYKSKAPGSPFAATSSFGAATMSCFLCGKHRPRAMLKSRKLLGKSQPVCAPSCKELEEQLAAKKAP